MTRRNARKACGLVCLALVLIAAVVETGGMANAQGRATLPGTAAPNQATIFTREFNTDRSGNDFSVVTLDANADIDACEKLCREQQSCTSFTFVKRSATVPQPVCRLKDAEPFGHKSSCCVSGLRQR